MARTLAAARVKPPSIELRNLVDARRNALVAKIRETPRSRRRTDASLRRDADELNAGLIERQRSAAVADAIAFDAPGAVAALEVAVFDLDAEIARANDLDDDDRGASSS